LQDSSKEFLEVMKMIKEHDIGEKDFDEFSFKSDLPDLITEQVYKESIKASKEKWRLGKLHEEWNELLLSNDNLVVLAPRYHLKTFFFSEMYPLQQCNLHPGINIRIFSGTDALAIEILDHLKKKWAIMPYFRHLMNGIDLDNKKQIRFSNGSQISAQGFWSKGRGGHFDIIIADDIIDDKVIYSEDLNKKSKERLASEIIPMAGPHTRMILTGTIQTAKDVYAVDWNKIAKSESLNVRNWVKKTYDSIVDEKKHITLFPEYWDWDSLMRRKDLVVEMSGLKWFQKEYRNMDVNLLGEIIKPEWKKEYDELPDDVIDIYTGWDLSVGKKEGQGDLTAKVTFGVLDKKIYIISVYEARIDFGKRIRAVVNQGDVDRPNVIKIEENVFQADTVQTAKANTMIPIEGVKTTINKIQKYNEVLVPLFENGQVYLKRGDLMQQKFWEQLCSLPRGAHDDIADAFCVGLKDLPFDYKATDFIVP